MDYSSFISHINTMSHNGQFSFGINWTDYVNFRLTESIIDIHKTNLKKYYPEGLDGKTVLDVGCGSGVSSLCFNMLGCKSIHSIDVNKDSILATKLTKEKFKHLQNVNCQWKIEEESILNNNFIENSKTFDIVYSWGVLHHTGDMWQSIKNIIKLVSPGGKLHLALYRSGSRYNDDLKLKMIYNLVNNDEKKQLIYNWLYNHFISKNIDIFTINERGMNKYNDCMDWLGGLPYEVCDPEILDCFLKKNSFERTFFKNAYEGGNFITTYQKI